jgi:hypothetical protein
MSNSHRTWQKLFDDVMSETFSVANILINKHQSLLKDDQDVKSKVSTILSYY